MDTMVSGAFVAELRQRLVRNGLSQSDLAARMVVHRSLVSLVLSGQKPVTKEFAISAAAVLGEDLLDAFNADLKAAARGLTPSV